MNEPTKPESNEQSKPGVHFKFDFSISIPPVVVVAAACLAGFILYLWVM